MRILFLSAADTCRGPMCEAYFNAKVSSARLKDVFASSAGILVETPEPVSVNARAVLRKNSLVPREGGSSLVTLEMMEEADLIVTMTSGIKIHVGTVEGSLSEKAHLLSEYASSDEDLCDPYGGSMEEYEKCFCMIRKAVDGLVKSLAKTGKQASE